jgi:hypothetical protein
MLETCRGPWFLINWIGFLINLIKSASRHFTILAHYYLWLTRPPPTLLYNQHSFLPNISVSMCCGLPSRGCRRHVPWIFWNTHWPHGTYTQKTNNWRHMYPCSAAISYSTLQTDMAYPTDTAPTYKAAWCDTPEDRTLPSSLIPLLAKSYLVVLTSSLRNRDIFLNL